MKYRVVRTSRLHQRIAEEGSGKPVILLHGFPEGAYSWRRQLPALASAGYRAVAPDQRGFAGTDDAAKYPKGSAPPEIEAYDQIELAADVIALMDTLGIERAPLVAHDWGAALAWNTALLHPDRVTAVVAMSVPFGGRPPAPPIELMEKRMGDGFFYMLYFQTPGVAEAELEADVRESLRLFFYASSGEVDLATAFIPRPKSARLFESMTCPPGLPGWLTEEDLDVYTEAFRTSGFRGPLNWYRNMNRTWERTAHLAGAKVQQPALFIAGDRDPVVFWSGSQIARMPQAVPNLAGSVMLPGVGHWTQQERPEEVNRLMIEFLDGLGP